MRRGNVGPAAKSSVPATKPAAAAATQPATQKTTPKPAATPAAAPAAASPAPAATPAAATPAAATAPKTTPKAAPKPAGKPAAKGGKAAPPAVAKGGKIVTKGAAKQPAQRRRVDDKNGGVLTQSSRAKTVVKALLNGAVKEWGAEYKDIVNTHNQQQRIVDTGKIREKTETQLENGTIKKSSNLRDATPEEIATAKAYLADETNKATYEEADFMSRLAASQTIRWAKNCPPALNALGCRVLNSVIDYGVANLGTSKMLTPEHLTKGSVDKIDMWPILRNCPTYMGAVFATRQRLHDKQLAEEVAAARKEAIATTRREIAKANGLKKIPRVKKTADADTEETNGEANGEAAANGNGTEPVADAPAEDAADAEEDGEKTLHTGVGNQIAFRMQQLRPDANLRVSKDARILLERLCREVYTMFALGIDGALANGDSKTANLEHLRTLVDNCMHAGLVPTTTVHLAKTTVPDPAAVEAETKARKDAVAAGVVRKTIPHSKLPQIETQELVLERIWPNDDAEKLWDFVMNSVRIYEESQAANKKAEDAAEENGDVAADAPAEETAAAVEVAA